MTETEKVKEIDTKLLASLEEQAKEISDADLDMLMEKEDQLHYQISQAVEARQKPKAEEPKAEEPKPDYIAYLELDEGDRLEVKREAKGLDLYFAWSAQFKGDSFEASLIATTCTRNGEKLTIEAVNGLDAEVAESLSEVLLLIKELKPIAVESFPKKYELGDKKVTLLHNRLIEDTAKAQSRANNDQAALAFWLLSFLVQIDGKALTYDDLLDMPAGEVQALMPLVTPKKNKFQLVRI